tara:strand:- start:2543 stop:3247 length:705 start_codon:yes stop_codon:yes gene_type:complete
MLFKTNLIEILLLLSVVILFAWIGVANQGIVPYNLDIVESMTPGTEVPGCSGHSNVPGCHDTIYSDYDPYSYDSNYILKTQVVPPVCPACPSVINSHNHGDNLYDGLVDESGNSIVQTSTEVNEKTQVSNTSVENTTINTDKSDTKNEPSKMNNSFETNNGLSDAILKRQREFYDKENASETVSGQCPPCPACERCPEPAFTCEKVVNYKSPSSKQYLPMPVLNDFSSFPSASS